MLADVRRRFPELNRVERLCRPLPHRSAKAPQQAGRMIGRLRAGGGIRTHDNLLTRQVLYQLSYTGEEPARGTFSRQGFSHWRHKPAEGVEPSTPRLRSECSGH